MYTNSDADDRLHQLYRYISDTAEFVSAGLSRLMRVFADSKVSSILRRMRDARGLFARCLLHPGRCDQGLCQDGVTRHVPHGSWPEALLPLCGSSERAICQWHGAFCPLSFVYFPTSTAQSPCPPTIPQPVGTELHQACADVDLTIEQLTPSHSSAKIRRLAAYLCVFPVLDRPHRLDVQSCLAHVSGYVCCDGLACAHQRVGPINTCLLLSRDL